MTLPKRENNDGDETFLESHALSILPLSTFWDTPMWKIPFRHVIADSWNLEGPKYEAGCLSTDWLLQPTAAAAVAANTVTVGLFAIRFVCDCSRHPPRCHPPETTLW